MNQSQSQDRRSQRWIGIDAKAGKLAQGKREYNPQDNQNMKVKM
jgi:hypothetical protein